MRTGLKMVDITYLTYFVGATSLQKLPKSVDVIVIVCYISVVF